MDGMLSKLVDHRKQCTPLYSLFAHEHFGYMLGCYVVEHNPGGGLSLRSQRLLPENLPQFDHLLNDEDRELVHLLYELTLQQLYKHFGAQQPSLQLFLKRYSLTPYKEYVIEYVQQRLHTALALLPGKPFYRMSKDGYPAWRELTLSPERAAIEFVFVRQQGCTEYSIRLQLGSQPLQLHEKPGAVICDNPAWLLLEDTVFTFADPVDGRKLLPFFKKPIIQITKEFEAEYYEKFLLKLIEQNEVSVQGIALTTVQQEPQFRLVLRQPQTGQYSFQLVAAYGEVEVSPADEKLATVALHNSPDGSPGFEKVLRSREQEKQVLSFFTRLQPNVQLFDFTLPEAQAYHWLANYTTQLAAQGIQTVHRYAGPPLQPRNASISFKVSPGHETGYMVQPEVSIGGQALPFTLVRDKLLHEQPGIPLPDGGVAYLPEERYTELRHFLEVAEPITGGFHLKSYQSSLVPTAEGQLSNGLLFQGFEQIEHQELPLGLQASLRDYQQAGYEWLCFLNQYGMGGILADDMGLGKTLQTLALLQREKERGITKSSLIVVPNSLIFNWLHEAAKFTPQLVLKVYGGTKKNRTGADLFHYDALITTYGLVRQDLLQFGKREFHYIILDESQFIKNKDAKTTQAVLKLKAEHRLSLTGTPIENSTLDLWTQMHFVNPGLLGSERFFEKFYAEPIERDQHEGRANRLRDLIRPFILRRTKDQVASELPPLIEQLHSCEMAPEQAELYERTRSVYRSTLFGHATGEQEFERNKIQILSSLQRLRQIAIHPLMIDPKTNASGKYEAMWALLHDILAKGSKVIIFSQFVKFLQILQYDLKRESIPFSYLDGTTKNRAKEVLRFQEDATTQLFLISLKAGGVGLNLTAAEYVLIMDPWWNPAVERQAMNRAHRIGQSKTVLVYKFITRQSIEEKILTLQQRKEKLAGEIIRTDEQFFKSLTKSDLLSLFE